MYRVKATLIFFIKWYIHIGGTYQGFFSHTWFMWQCLHIAIYQYILVFNYLRKNVLLYWNSTCTMWKPLQFCIKRYILIGETYQGLASHTWYMASMCTHLSKIYSMFLYFLIRTSNWIEILFTPCESHFSSASNSIFILVGHIKV